MGVPLDELHRRKWVVIADEYPDVARLMMKKEGIWKDTPKSDIDLTLSDTASAVFDFLRDELGFETGDALFDRWLTEHPDTEITSRAEFKRCLDELVERMRLLRWPIEADGEVVKFQYFPVSADRAYLQELSTDLRCIEIPRLYAAAEKTGVPVESTIWSVLHSDRFYLELPDSVLDQG